MTRLLLLSLATALMAALVWRESPWAVCMGIACGVPAAAVGWALLEAYCDFRKLGRRW